MKDYQVAGSFVASNLIIEDEKVDIEDRKGTLKEFIDTETGSGKPLIRFFCGTCGKSVSSIATCGPSLTYAAQSNP